MTDATFAAEYCDVHGLAHFPNHSEPPLLAPTPAGATAAPAATADGPCLFRGGSPDAADPSDDGGGKPPAVATPGETPAPTQQQQANELSPVLQPRVLEPALDSSVAVGGNLGFDLDNLANIDFYSDEDEELDLETLQNILSPVKKSTKNSKNEGEDEKSNDSGTGRDAEMTDAPNAVENEEVQREGKILPKQGEKNKNNGGGQQQQAFVTATEVLHQQQQQQQQQQRQQRQQQAAAQRNAPPSHIGRRTRPPP